MAGEGSSADQIYTTPEGVSYDLRWITSFVQDGDYVHASFWGDPTPRVRFDRADFLAAWSIAQTQPPRLPWQDNQPLPSTEYSVDSTTWNLLHVADWWSDEDQGLAYVRFYGQPTDFDGDLQALPITQFDLQGFTQAMNGG